MTASNSGFELSLAVHFGSLVLGWVRMASVSSHSMSCYYMTLSIVRNLFETQGNSIERLHQCWFCTFNRLLPLIHSSDMVIEQEPKNTTQGHPPAYWPSSGSLRVENLSARYSPVCAKLLLRSLRRSNRTM